MGSQHPSSQCGVSAECPRLLSPALLKKFCLQVRCLVDVPGEKLPEDLPAYLRSRVAPQLPDALRAAFLVAVDKAPIRSMQNKQLTSKPLHQPGECGSDISCPLPVA